MWLTIGLIGLAVLGTCAAVIGYTVHRSRLEADPMRALVRERDKRLRRRGYGSDGRGGTSNNSAANQWDGGSGF